MSSTYGSHDDSASGSEGKRGEGFYTQGESEDLRCRKKLERFLARHELKGRQAEGMTILTRAAPKVIANTT